MKRSLRHIVAMLLLSFTTLYVAAKEEIRDSVEIRFRQSKIDVDPKVGNNSEALARISDSLRLSKRDSMALRLVRVTVIGAASPEGSVKFNRWLSEQRAAALFKRIKGLSEISAPEMNHEFLGRDWQGLYALVEGDEKVPYREETLALIREIIDYGGLTIEGKDPLAKLKRLRGARPYNYMYKNLFPQLRRSEVQLWYEKVPNPKFEGLRKAPLRAYQPELTAEPTGMPLALDVPEYEPVIDPKKPFYMDIHTNMLYDVAALPNLGIEFYLGKQLSLSGDWVYAWWRNKAKHRYWRYYGGELTLRWWIGKKAKEKPLQGHHLGIYAQAFTYCFEWGGIGEIGGRPRGTIWDRCQYGAGIEYGYSLPVARRLNIEFDLAVGYVGGQYWKFEPSGELNLWLATKQRHYFGPTKVGINLVWLIGRGNVNEKKKKGGSR